MSGHKQNFQGEFQTWKVVDMVTPKSKSPTLGQPRQYLGYI